MHYYYSCFCRIFSFIHPRSKPEALLVSFSCSILSFKHLLSFSGCMVVSLTLLPVLLCSGPPTTLSKRLTLSLKSLAGLRMPILTTLQWRRLYRSTHSTHTSYVSGGCSLCFIDVFLYCFACPFLLVPFLFCIFLLSKHSYLICSPLLFSPPFYTTALRDTNSPLLLFHSTVWTAVKCLLM